MHIYKAICYPLLALGLYLLQPAFSVAQHSSDNRQVSETNSGAQRQIEPVAINRSPLAELQNLQGVGPGLAARIIRYREKHGKFSSVDELMRVKGIGPVLLKRNRKYIVLD